MGFYTSNRLCLINEYETSGPLWGFKLIGRHAVSRCLVVFLWAEGRLLLEVSLEYSEGGAYGAGNPGPHSPSASGPVICKLLLITRKREKLSQLMLCLWSLSLSRLRARTAAFPPLPSEARGEALPFQGPGSR